MRKAQEEIDLLNHRIEIVNQEKSGLEVSCTLLAKELEESGLHKERLVHELRCTRVEIEGCHTELREKVSEYQKIESELDVERIKWKEREDELMTRNRILNDEFTEMQTNVKELGAKVSIL